MMKKEEGALTMCWFGSYQPYATSVVHVPEQEISPSEIDKQDLIFIWDKYMKADVLTNLLGKPVPWSPALIEGFGREWDKHEKTYNSKLVQKKDGKCLGAVLLVSRLTQVDLNPLIEDYKNRGYSLKKFNILVGDLKREVSAFLP